MDGLHVKRWGERGSVGIVWRRRRDLSRQRSIWSTSSTKHDVPDDGQRSSHSATSLLPSLLHLLRLDPDIEDVLPHTHRHHLQHRLAVILRQPRLAGEDLAISALEGPADADLFDLPRTEVSAEMLMSEGGDSDPQKDLPPPSSPCSGTCA